MLIYTPGGGQGFTTIIAKPLLLTQLGLEEQWS